MVFITKPNMIFTNFSRDVGLLGYIISKNSRLSVLGLQIQWYSARFLSCTTINSISEILSRPRFYSMPVLQNKNGKLCSNRPIGLGLCTSLTCGSRPIMSRYLAVSLQPLVQCFSLESRISSFTLSSLEQRRYKTSKKSPKRPEHDSDSDTDDEEPIQGTKVLTVRLQSLRTDGILKKALGVARNKVEAAFYEGNIRVNGQKPMKKSHQLQIGDEVDLIRGVSPVNSDLLNVSRVEILSVNESDGDDQLSVKVRRTKSLYIENYSTDPWKTGSTEQKI